MKLRVGNKYNFAISPSRVSSWPKDWTHVPVSSAVQVDSLPGELPGKLSLTEYWRFFLFPFFFFKFYFIFKLYIIVLILPNIKMNPPQVYMCSPSWTLLPPHTIPLGRPSALAPSIQYRASNLDWQLVSYIIKISLVFSAS